MNMKYIVGSVALLGLTACGGGGGSSAPTPVTVQPVAFAAGSGAEASVTFDEATMTYTATVDQDSDTFTFIPGHSTVQNRFTWSQGTATSSALFDTRSDHSRASLIGYDDGTGTEVTVSVERLTPTTLPTGSATYEGDYVAAMQDSISGNALRVLLGDVKLTADFDEGKLSGSIERDVYFSNLMLDLATTLSDLTLEQTDITDGAFSGTVDAETFSLGSETLIQTTGSFDGLIAGQEGEEIVGGVAAIHSFPTITIYETGVFGTDLVNQN